MTKLTEGTWVVVADGEKALFLKNLMDARDPNLSVVEEEHRENPPDRAQSASPPGRHKDTGLGRPAQRGIGADWSTGQRSSYAETDWHMLEKVRFADDLAKHLYELAHKGAFSRLVLVAPPKILGELRAKLHKEVSDAVVGEIAKTLTNHPVDEIERLVAADLEAD